MGMIQESMMGDGVPQPGQPDAPAAPQGDDQGAESSWEERVVAAAAKILYDDKSGDSLDKSIMRGDAPTAVARTTADLIVAIDDKLGGQIPEEDILPAAMRTLERVIELREEASGVKMPDEEVKQAAINMTKTLAQAYGVTPEQAQGLMSEMGEQDVSQANQMFGGR